MREPKQEICPKGDEMAQGAQGEDGVPQKLGAATTQAGSNEPKFTVDTCRGIY